MRLVGFARTSGYETAVQRRQPLRLGNVVHGVGIEERIERRGRPCHRGQPIARGPAVDLPDVLDHQRVTQLFAQAARSTVRSPDATGRRRRRPQARHSPRSSAPCSRDTRSRGRNGQSAAALNTHSTSGRFAAAQSSAARMPASGPGKSATPSAMTGRPNAAKRAGSPLALRISPSHCGCSRAITRSRMVRPPIVRIGLSPPPMRRASPPASSTPGIWRVRRFSHRFRPCACAARIPLRHSRGSGRTRSAPGRTAR